jgi:hypothetical protein
MAKSKNVVSGKKAKLDTVHGSQSDPSENAVM